MMKPLIAKPLCLVVGNNSQRKVRLTRALAPWVTVVSESPENCVDAARVSGARVAVVLWSNQTQITAHRLSEQVPGLQVIVEGNVASINGPLYQNGFHSVVDVEDSMETIVNQVRGLSRDHSRAPKFRSSVRDLVSVFSNHLPAIQSSVGNRSKLCEELLAALIRSARASRGAIFFAEEEGHPFLMVAAHRCGLKKLCVPAESDIPQELEILGSAIHLQDEGVSDQIRNLLESLDCNLLIPLFCESVIAGWIVLHLNRMADILDYRSLEIIGLFASESFRINRELQARAKKEAEWQKLLGHAFKAVMTVTPNGFIEVLWNQEGVLAFKDSHPTSYRSLTDRRLKNAIHQCLKGLGEGMSWCTGTAARQSTSVHRSVGGGAIVLIHLEDAYNHENPVSVDRSAWEELAKWAKQEIPAQESDAIGNRTLESALGSLVERANVRLSLTETERGVTLNPEQAMGLQVMLHGILEDAGAFPTMIRAKGSGDFLRLTISCENSTASEQEPASADPLERQKWIGLGLILLTTAGVGVEKESAVFGWRWTFTLTVVHPACEEGFGQKEHRVFQAKSDREHLELPSLLTSDSDVGDEKIQGFSTPGSDNRRCARSPG